MRLRFALFATTLLAGPSAIAGHPLCGLLHHPHKGHGCCDNCEVHLHICEPSNAGYTPGADVGANVPAATQQLTYAQVLPSTAAYAMPMMSMPMTMGMAMPYPVQQVAMTPPSQQYTPPPAAQSGGGGSNCDERVVRLEEGVKHLSQRMDRIELLLENQTIALAAIAEKLPKGSQTSTGN